MNWYGEFTRIAGAADEIHAKYGQLISREDVEAWYGGGESPKKTELVNAIFAEAKRRATVVDGEEPDPVVVRKMAGEIMAEFVKKLRSRADIEKIEKARREREKNLKYDAAEQARKRREFEASKAVEMQKKREEARRKYIADIYEKYPHIEKGTKIAVPLNLASTGGALHRAASSDEIKKRGTVVADHPAIGKFCDCDGRIARVCQCMSDGKNAECAIIKYVDNGEVDVVAIQW